jgi:hypothetical protein
LSATTTPFPTSISCQSTKAWSDIHSWLFALRYQGFALALAHLLCAAAAVAVLARSSSSESSSRNPREMGSNTWYSRGRSDSATTAATARDPAADEFLETVFGPKGSSDCSCLVLGGSSGGYSISGGSGTGGVGCRGGRVTAEEAAANAFTGAGRMLGGSSSGGPVGRAGSNDNSEGLHSGSFSNSNNNSNSGNGSGRVASAGNRVGFVTSSRGRGRGSRGHGATAAAAPSSGRGGQQLQSPSLQGDISHTPLPNPWA